MRSVGAPTQKIIYAPIQKMVGYPIEFSPQEQSVIKGLKESMNCWVLIPSFKSTSPPPSQKNWGSSFTMASDKMIYTYNNDSIG